MMLVCKDSDFLLALYVRFRTENVWLRTSEVNPFPEHFAELQYIALMAQVLIV